MRDRITRILAGLLAIAILGMVVVRLLTGGFGLSDLLYVSVGVTFGMHALGGSTRLSQLFAPKPPTS